MDPSHLIAAQSLMAKTQTPDEFYDTHGHNWFAWRSLLPRFFATRPKADVTPSAAEFAAPHPAE